LFAVQQAGWGVRVVSSLSTCFAHDSFCISIRVVYPMDDTGPSDSVEGVLDDICAEDGLPRCMLSILLLLMFCPVRGVLAVVKG